MTILVIYSDARGGLMRGRALIHLHRSCLPWEARFSMFVALLPCSAPQAGPSASSSSVLSPELAASPPCSYPSQHADAKPPEGLSGLRVKPLDMQDEHTLQLVHIGKTGGSSVRYFLIQNQIQFYDYHVGRQVDVAHARFHDRWLVAVRDPIERALSAFNWRHPCGGAPNLYHHDPKVEAGETKLYGCFAHVKVRRACNPRFAAAA